MKNFNCDFIRLMVYFSLSLVFSYWVEQKIDIFLVFCFSSIAWLFDKILDAKVIINKNILKIYDFSYMNFIEKKPKILNFNEIKSVKKSSFSLKCFGHISIELKNGKMVFLNQAAISKTGLKTLLAI